TFVIDYFGSRGVTKYSRKLPTPYYDVFDGMRILATHPRIDAKRMAIMGFSRGADITLNTTRAGPSDADGLTLKAHVALYPGCGAWTADASITDAPILILVGDLDTFSSAYGCKLHERDGLAMGKNIRTIVYPGVHHGFDGNYTGTYGAQNRSAVIVSNAAATAKARQAVLALYNRVFAQ
ncbi:MAG: dienelactone hydrolase family protein, partial [Hyphomicrobiaceae bacterium]